jgi:cytochrome c peroxidase
MRRRPGRGRRNGNSALLLAASVLLFAVPATADLLPHPEDTPGSSGLNPHPVTLIRPPVRPLSALARIGKQIFFDPSLSASGKQSCASCHSPAHSYGPPNGLSVQPGGPHMTDQGFRAPPSLAYLYRQDVFGIGPSLDDDVPTPLDQRAQQAQASGHATKVAGTSTAAALVPRGGLFWDGRADTLMDQAAGPMMDPAEMANGDLHGVISKLALTRYRNAFRPLFGDAVVDNPDLLFAEAMSAVARYQVEDPSFHRFDSKYDHWLEGKARLSPTELRGLALFNDPAKGNCAGCHISQPSRDDLPPLFTDTEYEALGVPRNPVIRANRDPRFFDMGLCGPVRTDLARQTQYCGMFLTPTLRNVATRGVYFHNGMYHSLKQVLDFYNLRDVDPARIYPRGRTGKPARYDDLPARYHGNIDLSDAPFGRKPGDRPPLTDAEIGDIIAFIGTLSDGDTMESR